MQVLETNIDGVLVLEPKVFGDSRGYFLESFNQLVFKKETGLEVNFVQDNESMSAKNVLRGLHFQSPPHDQGKLIRVVQGSVRDIVVDIRKDSATYGKHFSIELDGTAKKMLWVPPGMAHGFASLEDNTIFAYKCTNYYEPSAEGCIMWNDADLNIDWGIEDPIISEKDQNGELFKDFKSPFEF
ncbi:dTDP-4-dehydrorhamnose 3,5-epimerase [Parvicella tangerina]|uniref:dTDP-4-dehydrorhamnose 3,5-epimerase n=1 Tax=Parvicella tangerina TaxID=2829795 RepID=A0A916JKD5_9FLAO|nr:dTDP-4-dehydrorhamnose 3,5-epimerase [Parvicella tangerina]CAG5078166.1 dTDP-4-dehydrorhamnose 3,5-epimerase [Parvicella tangerina]